MNRWVGVQTILSGSPPLKQEALIFNQVGVVGLKFGLSVVADRRIREPLRIPIRPELFDLLWLIEQGFIFDVDDVLPDTEAVESETFRRCEELRQEQLKKMDSVHFNASQDSTDFANRLAQRYSYADKAEEHALRGTCVQLRESCNIEAYPILLNEPSVLEDSHADKSDVVKIVLKALPIPDESTSWQQIMEYRSDPASQDKFLDLRNWMNEVARAELTPIEIEQKIEYLMSQYQRHMALHKMKTNTGTLETYLNIGAGFLENLLHLKPSKAVKALFSLKHRRISLMEGELNSPGSEVAYVINAREAFTKLE